ncbi:MAG: ribonuclease HII [Minisyncoccia bacterium]
MVSRYSIGIDEVGRGALAGPVSVGVLALNSGVRFSAPVFNGRKLHLRDSKKLTPKERERWVSYLKKREDVYFAVASVPARMIDKINISRAANLAATRAFRKLIKKNSFLSNQPKIFLDGGLYLNQKAGERLNTQTIIRGDEKITAIMLASIVAKVHRDKLMARRHEEYPHYDFPKHKGYGTARHMKSLKRHGLSEIHRKSFCRKFI